MRYVAFLRGINVGGRIIKMAELRTCFEKLGFANVATVLQTGNVVFDSLETKPRLTTIIENGLTEQFHYPAKVMIRSLSELETILAAYPFDHHPERHDYVIFLSEPIGQELINLGQADRAVEQVGLGDEVIYWQVQKGMSIKSSFSLLLSKAKYKAANTVRNINTLRKLQ